MAFLASKSAWGNDLSPKPLAAMPLAALSREHRYLKVFSARHQCQIALTGVKKELKASLSLALVIPALWLNVAS